MKASCRSRHLLQAPQCAPPTGFMHDRVSAMGAPLTVLVDAATYVYSAVTLSRIEVSEPRPRGGATARDLVLEIRDGAFFFRSFYKMTQFDDQTLLTMYVCCDENRNWKTSVNRMLSTTKLVFLSSKMEHLALVHHDSFIATDLKDCEE